MQWKGYRSRNGDDVVVAVKVAAVVVGSVADDLFVVAVYCSDVFLTRV